MLVRRSLAKLVNIFQSETISLVRSIGRRIAISFGQLITATRSFNLVAALPIKDLLIFPNRKMFPVLRVDLFRTALTAFGLTQVINFTRIQGGIQTPRSVQVVQAQSIIIRRALSKLILLIQTQLISLSRSTRRLIIVVSPQNVFGFVRKLKRFAISGLITGQNVCGVAEANILRSQTGNVLHQIIAAFEIPISGGGPPSKINVTQVQIINLKRALID